MRATLITFRIATVADVPLVINLPRPGEAGGDHRMAQYLAGAHNPQHALAPRIMWIAFDADRPIGYIAGHLTTRYRCAGELQWVYVTADHRRTAVATELLQRLAAWFVEHGAHRICVDVGDDDARPFYRRHGAVELNEHWMLWEDIGIVLQPPARPAVNL